MTTTKASSTIWSQLGTPFRWWFTPRSTDQDEAFRERCIRWILPLAFLFTTFLLVGQLATASIVYSDQVLYVMMYTTYIGSAVFLMRRTVDLSAYALGGLLVINFALDSTLSYWSPLAFGEAAFFMLMLALILPKNKYLMLFILLDFAAFSLHIPFTSLPSPLPAGEPYSSPEGAFAASTIFFLGGGGIVYFLLRQYTRQRDQLAQLVQTLEDRVLERTRQLGEAKDEADLARERAERADQIKSQFLASMSHELRTPLNAILNFTAFVTDGILGPVTNEQAEVLNHSIASGKHLLSLINDVLDITKIEAGMMQLFIQEVDFNEALAGAVSVGKGLIQDRNVSLVTEIDNDLPMSFGDKRRMRQVFLNLVSNAVKFTSEGSITITAKRKDGGIEVQVRDTGIGIAPEDQSLVFETFRQVNKHEKLETVAGTGLGMPISKYFVESHGGEIWFESEPGVGTTFYVHLPVLTREEATALNLQAEAPKA